MKSKEQYQISMRKKLKENENVLYWNLKNLILKEMIRAGNCKFII